MMIRDILTNYIPYQSLNTILLERQNSLRYDELLSSPQLDDGALDYELLTLELNGYFKGDQNDSLDLWS